MKLNGLVRGGVRLALRSVRSAVVPAWTARSSGAPGRAQLLTPSSAGLHCVSCAPATVPRQREETDLSSEGQVLTGGTEP